MPGDGPPSLFPRPARPLPKNLALPESTARQILEWIGIRTELPLITQVSRFDPWKDPLGVIAAYRMARADVPDLQLALVGSMASDDPEGWDMYRSIREAIGNDKRVHLLTNLVGGNIEVNAFQSLSNVVIQKSLREGFGLVVAEALWKGTPVIAGRAGGIPLQMADGTRGMLVDGVEECARAMVTLLADEPRARALGDSGRERVRRHFLIPRLVLDELSLMRRLAAGATAGRALEWAAHRDPVCGMGVEVPDQTLTHSGLTLRFCSEDCRATFARNPDRFLGELGAKPPLTLPSASLH